MIELGSKTEQVKDAILARIKNGEYKPGDKLPSIQDASREFNVSKHTVSQALSNLRELGVLDVAHGKVTRVSECPFLKTIELVYIGHTTIEKQEFWSGFFPGIIDEIDTLDGYSYFKRNIKSTDHEGEYKSVDLQNSAGVLLIGTANPKLINYFKQFEVPFVMLYERIQTEDMSYVSVDYRGVMKEMVDLFAKNGCRKLAYIGAFGRKGKSHIGINTHKYDCFVSALQRNELEVNPCLHKDIDYLNKYSYDATKELLDCAPEQRPDGIMIASDSMAPGVCRALYDSGIRIPEDICIAACDNLEISQYLIPSITSIELSRYRMGRQAVAGLIRKIENGKYGPPVQMDFVPEIVVRDSLR